MAFQVDPNRTDPVGLEPVRLERAHALPVPRKFDVPQAANGQPREIKVQVVVVSLDGDKVEVLK